MKTRIIVDSTSNLMPQIKERVHVVPLPVPAQLQLHFIKSKNE